MSDDEVGFCKPPKRFRFQPGRSGNPRGRPKRGEDRLVDAVDKILCEPVQVGVNGKHRRARRWEANARALIAHALKGDLAAAAMLLELRRFGRQSNTEQLIIEITGGLPDSAE